MKVTGDIGQLGPGLESITQDESAKERTADSRSDWIVQRWRAFVVVICFLGSCLCLHAQQYFGLPLYWLNKKLYYHWQAAVKESAALLLLGLNQWRAPTTVNISWDASVEGQIRWSETGKAMFDAPDRMVLLANHQIYTDWIYLWWSAYIARHHGHLIIVLKDALKKIPILGPGMMFFSFIFLSRRWEKDESQLRDSLGKLSSDRVPMWLLIFPEGTNLSARSRKLSKKWADKVGVSDLDFALLPRSRGLQACVSQLAGSVEWVYDCTIAYDGIPPGIDSQDVWNLKNMYVEGRSAPTAHIHWRRFAMSEIPVHDSEAFDKWLYARWAEKDELLKHHQKLGHFPSAGTPMRAKVELWSMLEMSQILESLFAVLALWAVVKLGLRAF
ncbi:Putative phospholipid/glycerol acyltransferase [Septoria linicola]|uniref:Phospholipid/glycerol acyltransferase n=1 Tax=Septoria linicola TaxID=215465 RepID=A0A9Q9AQ20_9PEZI|nr:Putative phospholipid/glycerol acyltransferase [Septoria linicola]